MGGALTVDGNLSANGAAGWGNGGGGSGGSILVTVGGLFTGAETSRRMEGTQAATTGAGGSGGRIAIYYQTDTFSNSGFSAKGGTGAEAGGAGTVFWGLLPSGSGGNLLIDNGGNSGATTPLPATQDFSKDDLILGNGAWVIYPVDAITAGTTNFAAVHVEKAGTLSQDQIRRTQRPHSYGERGFRCRCRRIGHGGRDGVWA